MKRGHGRPHIIAFHGQLSKFLSATCFIQQVQNAIISFGGRRYLAPGVQLAQYFDNIDSFALKHAFSKQPEMVCPIDEETRWNHCCSSALAIIR